MPEFLPVVQGRATKGAPPIFEKIGIVGLGLIGGSISLAARQIWPTSLVIAVDHKDVFLESAYQYAKLLPNNKLVEIHGTSHFPHLERTDEFNRLNIEFLQGR